MGIQLLVRFLLGGLIVSIFATLGDALRPKGFAGLFGAAPSIAWHEYLTRFLLGGVTTVAAGLIAKHWGPVVGGLFLAFPAIFPAGATLIEKQERDKKRRAGIPRTLRGQLAAALDARGTAMGTIGLAAFGLLVWKLLPLHDTALILAAALTVWLAVAVLIWRVRKMHLCSTAP
jgi:hypothetical protein